MVELDTDGRLTSRRSSRRCSAARLRRTTASGQPVVGLQLGLDPLATWKTPFLAMNHLDPNQVVLGSRREV